MDELIKLYELCEKVGPGATLILSLGVWWLNGQLKDARADLKAEQDYLRERDKETMTILGGVGHKLDDGEKKDDELKATVERGNNNILKSIEPIAEGQKELNRTMQSLRDATLQHMRGDK